MADIEITNYIKASSSNIFEALTTEKGLSETWTRQCDIKQKPGEVHEFGFGDEEPTRFEIKELVPGKKIIWYCLESDPEWIGTSVSFDLEERTNSTAVTLRHTGWKDTTEFYRWCNYNWSFFLLSLKQFCEQGKGTPFQERTF